MWTYFDDNPLTLAFFALSSLLAMSLVRQWLRANTQKSVSIPRWAWLVLVALILFGVWSSEQAERDERASLRKMLEGFAPTYAFELSRLGHERVGLDTPPDDPLYHSLIELEKQWLKINPLVNDIYTFRLRPDGMVVLLVDSETDYDRDGKYEGLREGRTAIGEEYPDASENLRNTFEGIPSFDGVPYTDRWGTWVSAYAPMRDSHGRVEAVLGVDYSAKSWVSALQKRRLGSLAYAGILIILYLSSLAVVLFTRYEKREKDRAQSLLMRQVAENERLAQAVDSSSDGIIITDPSRPDNPIIYANSMFFEITGYAASEAFGRNCRFLQGPDTDPETVAQVREAIRASRSVKVTILNYRKDGTPFWNGLRISPVMRNGKPQYFFGVVADVTQRKRAEETLIRERDHTASIIRSSPAIICGISPDGRINFVNPAGQAATGLSSDELVGKSWHKIFSEGNEQVDRLLENMKTGEVKDCELTFVTRGGIQRTISWNYIQRLDAKGKLVEIIGFGNDVTERHRAEEELRQSEEAFRFMLLSAPVMVWMANPDKEFVYVNRFWTEFTGRKTEEELGAEWLKLVHPEDKAALIKQFDEAFVNRWDFKAEFRLRHISGEHRWVVVSGTPRFREDGSFAGFMGSCLDIHERKKLESQLLQSQKMETVGTLAGGIAHDLNNQLTPLSGYIDLLLKEMPENEPNRELLVEAEQAARRCAEVVQRLMGFARASTQKKGWFKTEALLEELARLLPKFLPRTIEVRTAHPAALWPVMGNETELETVFMNLAANARDAMPSGGRLSISAENVHVDADTVRTGHSPGPHVMFTVQDNGSGIPADVLSKVFEPFFTTKQKGQGTGLGLAMVFRIVKDHGGWIDVSSAVGEGTAFRIYLPSDPKRQIANGDASAPQALPRGSETILFVDDEETLRNIGRVFLERLGYKVILAHDGEEAVRVYKERHKEIDAVVMDMTMPKLTGRQAMKQMLGVDPKVRILLASGYTSEGSAKELIQDGAAEFLAKPYTILPLAQALRKVFGRP